jgi:toxin ParE1/3/4
VAHLLLGRARDELAPALRSLAYGRYVICYRVVASGAEIVRALHGVRDIRRASESPAKVTRSRR